MNETLLICKVLVLGVRVVDGSEVSSANAGALCVDDPDTEHACNRRVHGRTTAKSQNIPTHRHTITLHRHRSNEGLRE